MYIRPTMRRRLATRKHPQLIVFLVNQSRSTENIMLSNNRSIAENIADLVNACISELILMATKMYDDDYEEVCDYQLVVVIGYGCDADLNKSVQILCADKLSDIASKYEIASSDIFSFPLHIHKVIKPASCGLTPMARAFAKAKECILSWKNAGHDDADDPSPVVINITDGAPTNDEGYVTEDAFEKTAQEVSEIMNIRFPNGAPRISNVLISQVDGREVRFPDNDDFRDEVGGILLKFLYHISSTVTEDLIDRISINGFGHVSTNSKILMANFNDPDTLLEFLRLGLWKI